MNPVSPVDAPTDLNLLLRLVVAALLALPLGLDREERGKDAGLRTHMLVAVSSALFVCASEVMVFQFAALGSGSVNLNPLYTLGAVATGVSFLGAGTIFVSRRGDAVHGLTTAASLLATAAVGVAVGLERYVLAVGAVLLLLAILSALHAVKRLVPGPPPTKRPGRDPA